MLFLFFSLNCLIASVLVCIAVLSILSPKSGLITIIFYFFYLNFYAWDFFLLSDKMHNKGNYYSF